MSNLLSLDDTLTISKKHLLKKRGRACVRAEKRLNSTEARVVRDRLAAYSADKEYRREVKQFDKLVKEVAPKGIHDIPMPDHISQLREAMVLAENNLKSSNVSHDAMSKYPPLPR
jgi:hypothetical protein